MGKDQGWIKLDRSIFDDDMFRSKEPISKREAWIVLLLKVNFEDRHMRLHGKEYLVKRGQSMRSLNTWAAEFNWSKSKVDRWFKRLVEEGKIETQSETVTLRLTICNYAQSQDMRNAKRNGDDTQYKEVKELKDIYAEIIGYLNETIKSGYKHTTKHTQGLINARTAEGFKVEDFKQVIGYKASQWISNPEMKKYLTPATLFSPSKFEKYLEESRSNNFSLSDDVTKIYNNCEPVRAIFFTKTHTRFVGKNAQLYFTLL